MSRVVAAVLAVVVLCGLAAGSAAVAIDDSRIEQSVGRTHADELVVDGYTLAYGDGGVTGMTVYVNKSGSALTGDVKVALSATDGTTVYAETKSDVLLDSAPTEVSFTFDAAYAVEGFARVRIVAAKSL